MRVLYALVGEPGVGKSTFVKDHFLESLAVSTDDLRTMFSGHDYTWDATTGSVRYVVSASANKDVFDTLHNIIEKKAQQGRTIVVDATHLYKGAFSFYKQIKEKYGYRIYAVDMRAKTQGLTFEGLEGRNETGERVEAGKNVSTSVLRKFWDRAKNDSAIPGFANKITEDQFEDTMRWNMVDDNKYAQVKVIGDVHGCYDVLIKALGELRDDTKYIFVGDYLDRGTQNAETFNWFNSVMSKPNVVLLRGNHELHYDKYINGLPVKGRETAKVTIPQLERSGIGKKELDRFRRHLQDLYMFTFRGKKFLVTHAGIPSKLLMDRYTDSDLDAFSVGDLPEDVFTKGIGNFKMDIDKEYEEGHFGTVIQIHGHRNEFENNKHTYIYNVEQKVERGGYLSVVTITPDNNGAHIEQDMFKNDNFRVDMAENDVDVDLSKMSDEQIMAVMDMSRDIINREVEPGIIAHNFSREVFQSGRFNKFTMTTRGLFTDKYGKVLGRGFNKFFNYGQNEETSPEAIAKHPYPVVVTPKFDGFLTIVFVVDGKLKVFSKGGSPEFSKAARSDLINHIVKTRGVTHQEAEQGVVDWFEHEGKGYSILLETIDQRDDHVVHYEYSAQYVLAAVKNQYVFEENDEVSFSFARDFNLEHTTVEFARNPEELQIELDNQHGLSAFELCTESEGVVARFDDGFRVKIKNIWYLETKELRSKLDQVKQDPQVMRERAYMNQRRGDASISFYKSVSDTVLNFLFNLSDDELRNLETRPNTLLSRDKEGGSVDVGKALAKYPELRGGYFEHFI